MIYMDLPLDPWDTCFAVYMSLSTCCLQMPMWRITAIIFSFIEAIHDFVALFSLCFCPFVCQPIVQCPLNLCTFGINLGHSFIDICECMPTRDRTIVLPCPYLNSLYCEIAQLDVFI